MRSRQLTKLKIICLIIILITTPILGTGCWDAQDISKRAFVTAIGLDLAEKTDRGKLAVTFEIINPGGFKGEQGKTPTLAYTLTSDSIPKAIEQLQARLSRSITLTHLSAVMVGENLARSRNFTDLSSYLEANPQVAMRLRLGFVQGGQAGSIIRGTPVFQKTVAHEYVDMSQMTKELSYVHTNALYHFLNDLRSTGGTAFGERVLAAAGGKMMIRHGGAVFSNWKLAGWLSSEESHMANWITGGTASGTEFKTSEGLFTYKADEVDSIIKPLWKNGQLSFLVSIKTKGTITSEIGKDVDLSKPGKLAQLEKELTKEIFRQAEAAVAKSQHYFRVDYLEFGSALKKYQPEVHKKINWESFFPTAPVKIEVKSIINRFGLAR